MRDAVRAALGPTEVFTGSLPQEHAEGTLLLSAGEAEDRQVESVLLRAGDPPAAMIAAIRAAAERLQLRQQDGVLRGSLQTIARRISHDLRTPLGSVLTLGQLLQELLPAGTEEQKLLATVVRSAEKMRELIEKQSFFARTSAIPLELEPLDMAEVVQLVRGRVEMQVRNRHARLEATSTWPAVIGNAGALEMVWRQLVGNALQHSGDTPHVTLGWREEDPATVRFHVRDHGPGIPPERRAGIFVPFEKLHSTLSTHGLGLTLVKHIITQHGGNCGAEAMPEGGFEAWFTLRKRA